MGKWQTDSSITPIKMTLFDHINGPLKEKYGKTNVKSGWTVGNKLKYLEIEGMSDEDLNILITELKNTYPQSFETVDRINT